MPTPLLPIVATYEEAFRFIFRAYSLRTRGELLAYFAPEDRETASRVLDQLVDAGIVSPNVTVDGIIQYFSLAGK